MFVTAVIQEPFSTIVLIGVLRERPRGRGRDPTHDLRSHIAAECIRPLVTSPEQGALRARFSSILPVFAQHRAALFEFLKPTLGRPARLRDRLEGTEVLLEDALAHPPRFMSEEAVRWCRFGLTTLFRSQRRWIDRLRRARAWPPPDPEDPGLERLSRALGVAAALDLAATSLGLALRGEAPPPTEEVASELARAVHDLSLEHAAALKLFFDGPRPPGEILERPSDAPEEDRLWSELAVREWVRAFPQG